MAQAANHGCTPFSVDWEGDFFQHHSLSQINKALCARLLKAGFDLAIRAADLSLTTDEDRCATSLSQALGLPGRAPTVTVRHSWPPRLSPRPAQHWVHIQPWEFGGIPDAWTSALQDATEVWSPSSWVRDHYVCGGIPPERAHVVPNGVDTDLFKPGVARYKFSKDRSFRFLFVGGFIGRKGIDLLLNAYRRAFSHEDDVCLVLKGFGADGVYANGFHREVRSFASDADVAAIELIEADLSDGQMAELYRSCDALVHPYRGEGFAMPVAEAMASGVPVVVTADGATADFCDEDDAWLLPSRRVPLTGVGEIGPSSLGYWLVEPDLDYLTEIMRDLPNRQVASAAKAARARERVVPAYSWDAVAQLAAQRLRHVAAQDSGPTRRRAKGRHQAAGKRGHLYFLCGEEEHPGGGMRVAYRHARLLAEAGVEAAVLHMRPGYRCPDIADNPPVVWAPDVSLVPGRDLVAVPEVFSNQLPTICPGIHKVIFNQNPFLMFNQWPLGAKDNPYAQQDVVATVCVSDKSAEHVGYALPGHQVERLHLSVDYERFRPAQKRPVIAFMPRKNAHQVLQVVSILECRKALENWELAAIDKASSEQVAETLSTAAVYLSTGTHESFPLSVLEAMASGCVVVGYDGFGAAELMREGLSVPVPSGDVLAFASQVERVVKAWGTGQEWVRRIGPAAAKHVRACFSFEREAADVVEVWGSLLDAVVAKADGASHTERSAAGTPEPPSILMAKGAEGNGKTHAKARVITERGPARALNWPPTTGRPLLSACLITKDEEEALPDCLRSLYKLTDEVVVYDTGSTDITVNLAKRAGAQVIEGQWYDDFSRARNASLEHCRGEWILWIDADERFSCPNMGQLRAALEAGIPGDALAIEIYNLGDDPDDPNISVNCALRVFRRDRCRWYGSVHEQLDLRPGLGKTLQTTPLKGAHIDHVGYRSGVSDERDKLSRNLRLAELALARKDARPGQEGVARMNVGRALVALGRFQEAQTYFDAALDEGGEGISLRAKLLFSAQNLIQIGLFEKAIEQAHLLRAKSERKDLSYYLEGVARRRTGQPAQAAELLEQVTEMSNEAGYVFPRCMLRGQLAGALLEAGRAGEAADQLSLLVRESPEEPNIRTALKVFAVTGVSLEDLAAALPEDRLDKVATALILLPPVVADRVAEGLFIRFGPKPILLAAAIKFAPMIAIGRALEWSARLRQIGMIEPCPLIAQARTNALEVGTRIRAAVTAHAAFGDNRGANLAKALATSLHQDQLEVALSEVSVLDPPLARDFALAAAAPGAPSAGR